MSRAVQVCLPIRRALLSVIVAAVMLVGGLMGSSLARADTPGPDGAGPASVQVGSYTDVFNAGPGRGLYETWYGPHGWVGSEVEVPGTVGTLYSQPTAVQVGGYTDLFWRGPDNGLYETWYVPNGWVGTAIEVPGTNGSLYSAPSAVQVGGYTDVYWRNADNWKFARGMWTTGASAVVRPPRLAPWLPHRTEFPLVPTMVFQA